MLEHPSEKCDLELLETTSSGLPGKFSAFFGDGTTASFNLPQFQFHILV